MDLCFEIVKRAAAGFVYSESVASHYIKQLLLALHYLHSKSLVHRNLRIQACRLANQENSAPVKLTSFRMVLQLSEPTSQVKAGSHLT